MQERTPPVDAAEAPKTPLSRRAQLAEMLVLLSLVLPSAALNTVAYRQAHYSFELHAWGSIVKCLPLTALLLFLLWHNGESRRTIGWQFRWHDLVLGVFLYVPYSVIMRNLRYCFWAAGLGYPRWYVPSSVLPVHATEYLLAVAMTAVVAIWEESLCRGYLLVRLRGLGANAVVALLASTLIFALSHAYQGSLGVAATGVMGLLLGLISLWRKNLTAPMVLHFLHDLAALHVLPVLFAGP